MRIVALLALLSWGSATAWAESPTIVSVTSSDADGNYVSGQTLTVTVTFSEAVEHDSDSVIPYVVTDIGYASLASGSGTAELTFSIVIEEWMTTDDLSAESISLNLWSSATHEHVASGDLPASGADSLAGSKDITVDNGRIPCLAAFTAQADGQWAAFGDTASIEVSFTERVQISASCLIAIDLASGHSLIASLPAGRHSRCTVDAFLDADETDVALLPIGARLLSGSIADIVTGSAADLGWEPACWDFTASYFAFTGQYDRPLLVNPRLRPSNDRIAQATRLTGSVASAWGTTIGASPELIPAFDPAHEGVWYRWTAPTDATARVHIRTPTTPFGQPHLGFLRLGVFSGNVDDLTLTSVPTVELDDARSQGISFSPTAGSEYLLWVASDRSASAANFHLLLSTLPAVSYVYLHSAGPGPTEDRDIVVVSLFLSHWVHYSGAGSATIDLSLDGRRVTVPWSFSTPIPASTDFMTFIYTPGAAEKAQAVTLWPGAEVGTTGTLRITDATGTPVSLRAPPSGSRADHSFWKTPSLGLPAAVHHMPEIPLPTFTGWVGEPVNWSREFKGGPGTTTVTVADLPPGLTASITERFLTISGIPTAGGCSTPVATLTNGRGSTREELRLRIMPIGASRPPTTTPALDFYGHDKPAGALVLPGAPESAPSDGDEASDGCGTGTGLAILSALLAPLLWIRRRG